MKYLNRNSLLSFFFLLLISKVHGQGYAAVVKNLNKVYQANGASTVSEPITFDSLERLLVIDNYEVPMSDDTFIQCVKNRKWEGGMKYSAKFYMQQGELIKLRGNELIQKSFLAIPISDKETCKSFVYLLEQLKKE